jgi:hypothetical protein
MLRAHLSHPLRKCRDDSIPILNSAGVRLERRVIGEIIQPEGESTCAPLTVTSYRDDKRPVGSVEQLVRNQIGMSISPPRRIFARDEDVLRDVH